MKNLILFFIFLYSSNINLSLAIEQHNTNILTENVTYLSENSRKKLEKYLNIVRVKESAWSSQQNLIYTLENTKNTYQLYSLDLESNKKKQITDLKEPIEYFISCRKNTMHDSIIFLSDEGGNENFQIYNYAKKNKKIVKISQANTRNTCPICSDDGSSVIWHSTSENKNHIAISKLATNEQEILFTTPDGTWVPVDLSSDNKHILLLHYISNYESELYILEVETKRIKQINPTDKKISYTPLQSKFYKNNTDIIFISDQNSNFNELISYDIASKKTTSLTPNIKNNVEQFQITSDNKSVFFTTNNNGYSDLFCLNLEKKVINKINTLPKNSIINSFKISHNNKQILFTIESALLPSSTFIYDVALNSFSLIDANNKQNDSTNLVNPTLISYPSFDKINNSPRKIPAFIYKPKNSLPPYPVIIYIHGGPEEQERPVYSGIYQYWLNELNTAIITPNVRGSKGYGKEYLNLDNALKREDSVKDIGSLLEWIKTQKDLDHKNIGIIGKSYGGFMSLSTAANFSDKIKAAVDIVGISNFITFLEGTSEYRRNLRRAEYGDERNPEIRKFLSSISPLSKVNNIKKPLFIIQGLNDPRVPVKESEQMRDALKNTGTEVWYMLAKNEGHGYAKADNLIVMYDAITDFWKKNLTKK